MPETPQKRLLPSSHAYQRVQSKDLIVFLTMFLLHKLTSIYSQCKPSEHDTQSRNLLDIHPPCSPEDHFPKLIFQEHSWFTGLPGWHCDKESSCNAGLILRSGRCLGGGHGHPFQYSCLENPMDRGARQLTVMGSRGVEHY